VATVGLLDALATLAYSFGISATSPLFVAPPAALSAVLTATLGCVVLGEQLGGRRLTGVILALGGTMLLSPLVR
jgi:drug/metabolite transporter (DMT)-like permease